MTTDECGKIYVISPFEAQIILTFVVILCLFQQFVVSNCLKSETFFSYFCVVVFRLQASMISITTIFLV